MSDHDTNIDLEELKVTGWTRCQIVPLSKMHLVRDQPQEPLSYTAEDLVTATSKFIFQFLDGHERWSARQARAHRALCRLLHRFKRYELNGKDQTEHQIYEKFFHIFDDLLFNGILSRYVEYSPPPPIAGCEGEYAAIRYKIEDGKRLCVSGITVNTAGCKEGGWDHL